MCVLQPRPPGGSRPYLWQTGHPAALSTALLSCSLSVQDVGESWGRGSSGPRPLSPGPSWCCQSRGTSKEEVGSDRPCTCLRSNPQGPCPRAAGHLLPGLQRWRRHPPSKENPGSKGQKEMGCHSNRTSQWACPAGSHCPGHLHRACHLSPRGWVLQPVAAPPRPSPPPKPLHCSG